MAGAAAGAIAGTFIPLAASAISTTGLFTTATTIATAVCADGDCTNEAVSVVNAAATDGDPTNEIQTAIDGIRQVGYTVYRYSENGITRYIGITNNFSRRAYEHFVSRGWRIEVIEGLNFLPRIEARGAEQVLIETYGLNNLYNKINSIAWNNPVYKASTQLGRGLLEKLNLIK